MEALKLINPVFDFEFAGEVLKVKKATLDQVILFQTKFNELTEAKDPAVEKKMAAYCLFLVVSRVKPEATEQWVMENTPDVEMPDVVEQFGFLSRQKVEKLRGILNKESQRNAPVEEKEQIGG